MEAQSVASMTASFGGKNSNDTATGVFDRVEDSLLIICAVLLIECFPCLRCSSGDALAGGDG